MNKGKKINEKDFDFLRPENSLSAKEFKNILNKRLRKSIRKGQELKKDFFDRTSFNTGIIFIKKLLSEMNSKLKIGAIVLARCDSTRLPGKVLRKLNGKPLIWYCLERIKKVKEIDSIIITTSDRKK